MLSGRNFKDISVRSLIYRPKVYFRFDPDAERVLLTEFLLELVALVHLSNQVKGVISLATRDLRLKFAKDLSLSCKLLIKSLTKFV